jgi:hypothetical protein
MQIETTRQRLFSKKVHFFAFFFYRIDFSSGENCAIPHSVRIPTPHLSQNMHFDAEIFTPPHK